MIYPCKMGIQVVEMVHKMVVELDQKMVVVVESVFFYFFLNRQHRPQVRDQKLILNRNHLIQKPAPEHWCGQWSRVKLPRLHTVYRPSYWVIWNTRIVLYYLQLQQDKRDVKCYLTCKLIMNGVYQRTMSLRGTFWKTLTSKISGIKYFLSKTWTEASLV